MANVMEQDLTEEQKECIRQLKMRVDGLIPEYMYKDDYLFLRFLIARDYDLNAAELMLKKSIEWRKNTKADVIYTWFKVPEVAEKYVSVNPIGHSKDGWPVIFVPFGKIDLKGFLKSVKKSEANMFIVHLVENELRKARERFKQDGKRRDRLMILFDLANFSLSTATHKPILEYAQQVVNIIDGNYPEVLHAAFVINASFYFTLFWAVVSPFLAKATLRKFRVFGKDGWKNELLKVIDPDILPVYLGGTLIGPDGDPMCKTMINYGGTVPLKYYMQKDDTFRKKEETKKCVVYQLSKETVEVPVEEPGSLLDWEFEVKSRDIGFSVLYRDLKDHGSIPKEIFPHQRIDTLVGSEKGMIKCSKAGTYLLEFDNTYSWMFSKEIYYTFSVLKPDQPIS